MHSHDFEGRACDIDSAPWLDSFDSLPSRCSRKESRIAASRRFASAPTSRRRATARADAVELRAGVVTAVHHNSCRVEVDGTETVCRLRELTGSAIPVVGDEVRVSHPHESSARIEEVLPRRTTLARADPTRDGGRRILATNVDVTAIVVTLAEPTLRPRFIERCLVLASRGGIEPLVVVNKIDLVEDRAASLAVLEPYHSLGVAVLTCSTRTGEGIGPLATLLAGRTTVLLGHSGVGKTSLATALGAPERVTQELRRSGRGSHTTTVSALVRLPGEIRLIDTPGIRELGMVDVTPTEIREYFSDLASCSSACRFADCRHVDEPICGVRDAVRMGTVPRARYESYLRLLGAEPMALIESFPCGHCGQAVAPDGAGSQHRNHCPHCLWSRHLDHRPGDRVACCGAMMEPVAVWVRRDGEWAIIHRCAGDDCGAFSSNRIAADDNEMLLLSLAAKPLARPPFPLDRLS